MSTLYDVLGIGRSASEYDVRKAYKRKALETHPDKLGPNASERQKEIARTRFQKVHDAFNILVNQQKRKEYDAFLAKPSVTSYRRAERNEHDDEQAKRMKDRMDWAQQQKRRDQERINAMRAQDTDLKNAQEKKEREVKMTKEFLQELFSMNPEWEERKRRIDQQRAQSERTNIKRAAKR
ncbi:hypothetical protein APHAL10511_004401 [Amanita phalloides]|nr:hypothetical protein APHAL10511_004401 [Amanita phalloides]